MSYYTRQTITQVHHWDDKLFSFKCTRDPDLQFENGQFVLIGLMQNEKPLLRAYSFVNANHEPELEFLSIKVPEGALTSRLQHIQPGDELIVAKTQYAASNNMTDRMASLSNIVHNGPANPAELSEFFDRFRNEALAVDKWFMLQATVPASNESVNTLNTVRALLKHPSFTLKNPNRARSLLAAFAMQNPSVFHSHSGEGYSLWADLVIELNTINPQVAARMARGLDRWTKLVPALQEKAREQLERIFKTDQLSPDVREVIGKALDAATH